MMPTDHEARSTGTVPPYSRADAITDGLLIEVPERLSRMFRFTFPMAVTQGAWRDAVAWDAQSEHGKPRRTQQSESGRITDLLWAARTALFCNDTGSHDIDFVIHRVPATGPETRALRRTMVLHLHPGDHGETVATIGLAHVQPAGHFHRTDDPWTWWPATGFDRDSSGRLTPVVTLDTLDAVLAHITTDSTVDATTGTDGAVDVHQDGITTTLRPDTQGRYHLRPLDWSWLCRTTTG